MYEYISSNVKNREKGMVALLFVGGFGVFAASLVPAIPYRSIWQFVGIFLLTVATLLLSTYLLRFYAYTVAPRDGQESAPPDFTITQYRGKQMTVVCRISVSDITCVTPLTKENRKEVTEMTRGKRVYRYTDRMGYEDNYLLTIQDEDVLFYIRILADEKLISYLQ